MMSNFIASLFSNSGSKSLKHKLPTSSAGRSSSVWSYSYDLELYERYEAASNLAKKSEHSETDVWNKSGSLLILDEDIDTDCIFQENRQIHESAAIEGFGSLASEVSNNINLKSSPKYRECTPRNYLKTTTKVSLEESLNNFKSLGLSDLQNQRLSLEMVTRLISNDMNHEMMPRKSGQSKSQIQAIVDYIPEYIKKTVLPAIQKCEQQQKMYSIKRMEWIKQVKFLERWISQLKSVLQNADKGYRGTEKKQPNLKKRFVPHRYESGGRFEYNLEAEVVSDGKQNCSASELQWTVETDEFTELKLGFYRSVNALELERMAIENETPTYYENLHKVTEKLDAEDSRNFQPTLPHESLQSRNIVRKSKNTTITDGPGNLKVGNASSGRKGANDHQLTYILRGRSEENSLFTKLDDVQPVEVTSCGKSSRDQRGGGRRTVEGEVREYVPCIKEVWGDSFNVSVDTEDLLESNPYVLRDCWLLEGQDESASTLNRRVSKVKEERRFVDFPKISPPNTFQSLECINQYRMDRGLLKRSHWL